jgi:glycosyltransferase involved in cell wall biosynthesis
VKILFVSHTAKWAGAEACLYQLLRGLNPELHEPLVVLPAQGPLETRLEDLGVPIRFGSLVHWIGQASTDDWKRFGTNLSTRVDAMARRIEREHCDVVFTNTAVVLEGALAAHAVGVPHVWRIHEMLARHTNLGTTLSLETFYRLLDTLSDRVVVVSESVRSTLELFVRKELVEVVYNGVGVFEAPTATRQELFGEDATCPLVVFVGTISDAKGAPLLAPVMERVIKRIPNAHCVLIGEDVGAKAKLEKEIRARGLESAFRFFGFRPDARELVARADVLILPSEVDSLPNAVLEAMAAGIPAVATRSGGASELVLDGETGFLVPVGDVEAMARGLVTLLSDAEARSRMGKRAELRACSEFSETRYVKSFERLFDELAPRRRPGAPEEVRQLVRRLASAGHDRVA